MPERPQTNADERDGERNALGDALVAQLDSDARFASGLAFELSEEERLRIQTAGASRPSRARMSQATSPDAEPVPAGEPWAGAAARLLQLEQSARKSAAPAPARAPALEEAERFLRELEAQPRDLEDDEPESEVAF